MIAQTLREAVELHQAGRFVEAEGLYRRVLRVAPNNPDASHLMGIVAHQQGRHHDAMERIALALRANDAVGAYHNNMGAAQRAVGLLRLAEGSFIRAAQLSPMSDSAWSNLIAVLDAQDEKTRINGVLDEWVRSCPSSRKGREVRAAHRMERGDLAGAIADQAHLAVLDATDPDPCLQVAILSHQLGDDVAAMAAFSDARDRHTRGSVLTRTTVQTKLQHDIQQLQWLMDDGNERHDWARIRKAYEGAYTRLYGDHGAELAPKNLDPQAFSELGEWYNRPFQVEPCPALTAHAVSSGCDAKDAEAQYLSSDPGVTTLDGLLTPQALVQLRRFCMGSTIWSEFRYNGGYVGTTLAQGFANGLLLQIARELRERMPTVLGPHPLRQMWAFKYDQRRTGVGVHADQAAVNVNFWITPDEANSDHGSGGLVVWRKRAPMEWDFEEFNRAPEKLVAWVRETGAEKIRIPYRCNRAVLFDSNLVHCTDEFEFAPGYENRRINITMLFGNRSG
jgi:tetratricopeptide (TPR) repeat protein